METNEMDEPVLPADTVCTLCGEPFAMNGPLHICPQAPHPAESVATTTGLDLARHADFCHNSQCLLCAPAEVRQGIEAVWERYERRLIDGTGSQNG